MNCCNANGNCTQGPDCPARIKSTRPVWMDGKACAVPPEAGNVRLPPVDYDDGQPLSHDETMALVRTLLLWLLAVVCVVAAVSMTVGYSTERWADVLWAYLAALS